MAMKCAWIGLWMVLVASMAQASMMAVQSDVTCTDYRGGESDLTPDQSALIPEGGVLTICRQPGKNDPVSYRTVSKPILGPQNICRVTKSGTLHAALAQNGICPDPNDAAYSQLLDKASDEDFLMARQLFEKMAMALASSGSKTARPSPLSTR